MNFPCPICGRIVEAPADATQPARLPREFPFCSERCRLIDLGRWFDGEYRIPGAPLELADESPDSELEPEPESESAAGPRRTPSHPRRAGEARR